MFADLFISLVNGDHLVPWEFEIVHIFVPDYYDRFDQVVFEHHFQEIVDFVFMDVKVNKQRFYDQNVLFIVVKIINYFVKILDLYVSDFFVLR